MTVNKKLFGTFEGVFIPSILTILGIIMYLRMGWVVANAGLVGTLVIISVSSFITFLTALSVSSMATNMKVKSGGIYYVISRSFGIEVGAAIGIPLFLSQVIGITFYLAGFSESLKYIFPNASSTIIAVISLLGLTALTYYSTDLAMKVQTFIFIAIVLSLVSLFLGQPVAETNANLPLNFSTVSYLAVFALFFPAVTGISTGLSMSGDLKNPAKSIPLGTMAAVIVGYIIYMAVAVALYYFAPANLLNSNSLIVTKIAYFAPIIFLGIWTASLSSALGSLLAAPRTLQALAKDNVLPKILGKEFGISKSPHIATFISILFAGGALFLGGIDIIAPILSMFFLTSYGALNLAAGLESFMKNPSWRPQFKTHWSLSFLGAALCFSAMFLIHAPSTILAFISCFCIYLITHLRNISSSWSDIRQGLFIMTARFALQKISSYKKEARTWRPHILFIQVLENNFTSSLTNLIYMKHLTQNRSFISSIFLEKKQIACVNSEKEQNEISMHSFIPYNIYDIKKELSKNKINSFSKIQEYQDYTQTSLDLIQDYSIGPIEMNSIVLNFPKNNDIKLQSLLYLIDEAKKQKKNVLIFNFHNAEKIKKIELFLNSNKNAEGKNAENFLLVLSHMLSISLKKNVSCIVNSNIENNTEDNTEDTTKESAKYIVEKLKKELKEKRLRFKVIDSSLGQKSSGSILQRITGKGQCLQILNLASKEDFNTPEEYLNYWKGLQSKYICNAVDEEKNTNHQIFAMANEEISFNDVLN
ncbi:MAG: amino acid permease [Bdellovibrionales bacterium]|nr:amino acid permease [Bdellovibrionales bacterium]